MRNYIERKDQKRLMRIYSLSDINSINFSGMQPGVVVLIDASLGYGSDRLRFIFDLIVRNKVYEICSVGSFAECFHDYFDAQIEEIGNLEIITTACVADDEGVEYFIYGAGAAERDLVAVINDNSYLLKNLVKEFDGFQND